VLERRVVDAGLVQREQQAAWEAALAATGLPVAGLDATRPRPRFALAAPLSAGIPGEAELADLWLAERLPVWRVREALGAALPDGWRLRDLYDIWLGAPALPGQVAASVYRATLEAGAADAAALAVAATTLLAADALPRERQKGDRRVAYDLRPLLDAIEITRSSPDPDRVVVLLTLRHDPEKGVGRPDETLAALGEQAGLQLTPVSVVRAGLVLADPVPRTQARPLRRGAGGRQGQPPGAR
jgi:radical SAM-linked protein